MADIQTSVQIGDASVIAFLNTITLHPFIIFLSLFTIWLSFFIYKKPREFKEIALILLHVFSPNGIKRKRLKKFDLVNHQIFSDLDFWIEQRIEQIYSSGNNTIQDEAKVEIAKDLLLTQFSNVRHWLKCFIEKTDFEDPYVNVRSILSHKLEKNASIQYNEYKKLDIPKLFIQKYLEISRLHENYLNKCLDDTLSDKIPLSIYEKVYIVLGKLLNYYSSMLIDMQLVVHSINGDLKGQVYKDKIIGGNDYRIYPVPSKQFVPLVEEKLKEVASLLGCSRASIYVFHDVQGDDFSQGLFSRIYSYEVEGYNNSLVETQYKPTIILSDMLPLFKQHKGFAKPVKDCSDALAGYKKKLGCSSMACYPIFLYDKLRGFIACSWSDKLAIENYGEDVIMETLSKYGSLLNIYIDYGKTGFKY